MMIWQRKFIRFSKKRNSQKDGQICRPLNSEKGGILLIFVFLLPILAVIIGGILSHMHAQMLYKRLAHAVYLYLDNKEAALALLPKNEWGVVSSEIIHDEKEFKIIGKMKIRPFFFKFLMGEDYTYTRLYDRSTINIVALVDLFFPETEMEHFQKLTPFLEALKILGQKQNVDLKIVPYAGSINIGTEHQDWVNFPLMAVKSKMIARKILDFEKLSPYQAILKNKTGELVLGDQPDPSFWGGCIQCRQMDIDFESEKNAGFLPYFWPSSFGKRYMDVKKDLLRYAHPRLGQIIISGNNNWTTRTIRESRKDYQDYGGFVLGPNVGCPPALVDGQSFDPALFYPITRGGSMLPLAFDYAQFLLKDAVGKKIILIQKSTPFLSYHWQGPKVDFFQLVTESSGFPIGSQSKDYNAYDIVTDQKMVNKLKSQIETFRERKNSVLGFSLGAVSFDLMQEVLIPSEIILLLEGERDAQEIHKIVVEKLKGS